MIHGRSPGKVEKAAPVQTLTNVNDTRIDAGAIPRPISHHPVNDVLSQIGGPRHTPDAPVPPSRKYVTFVEESDSTARYIRCSQGLVAVNRSTHETSKMPLTLIIQPFPQLNLTEARPPVVDLSPLSQCFNHVDPPKWDYLKLGSSRPGPIRCTSCGSYVNPFYVFAVRTATCNLCKTIFEMPQWYATLLHEHQASLGAGTEDNIRQRLSALFDLGESVSMLESQPVLRAELIKGSIDYVTHAHPIYPSLASSKPNSVNRTSNAEQSTTAPSMSSLELGSTILGAGYEGQLLYAESKQRPHNYPLLIFVVDSSYPSFQSGYFVSILNFIKNNTSTWPADATIDIAVITFDQDVSLYLVRDELTREEVPAEDLKGKLLKEIQVVNVNQTVFLPTQHVNQLILRIKPQDPHSIALVTEYIDSILRLKATEANDATITDPSRHVNKNACGSALMMGIELVKTRSRRATKENPYRGGLIQLFTTSHPTCGYAAKLTPLLVDKGLNLALLGKKKEDEFSHLVEPRCVEMRRMVELCVRNAISIELFAASTIENPEKFDLSFLGCLAAQTGGVTHYYRTFTCYTEYDHLYYDMHRTLITPLALDCAFKIRVSKGIEVKSIQCPWSAVYTETGGAGSDPSSFQIPRLQTDVTLNFLLGYASDSLDSKCEYAQVAFSYTDHRGIRMLRVLNKRLYTANTLATVFRNADGDAVAQYFTRRLLLGVLAGGGCRKQEATSSITEILSAYRLHVSGGYGNYTEGGNRGYEAKNSYGQLILPETLKLLPVYATGLFKSEVFRSNARIEDRWNYLLTMLRCPVQQLLTILYPFVYPIYRPPPISGATQSELEAGNWTGIEVFVHIPTSVPSYGNQLTNDGLYLMDDGLFYSIYVGKQFSQSLEELMGYGRQICTKVMYPFPPRTALNLKPNNIVERIHNVIHQLTLEKLQPSYQPIRLIPAGSLYESDFIWHLTEDRLGAEQGYIDFLCDLHRNVQKDLALD